MLVEISSEEYWPLYCLHKCPEDVCNEYQIEYPDELYEEYVQVMQRFEYLQKCLEKHFKTCKDKEAERYYREVDQPRSHKINVVNFDSYIDSTCSICEKKQSKAIYQGTNYIGCEHCHEIKPLERIVQPEMIKQSFMISQFANDSSPSTHIPGVL